MTATLRMSVCLALLLVALVCPALAITSYTPVLSSAGQYGVDFGGLYQPVGPFASYSDLGIQDGLGKTWQIVIPLKDISGNTINFPFYGGSYSSVTLTSKGFMYLGSYPASGATNGVSSLPSVAAAPNYQSGTGFAGTTPVISFLHNAQGSVDGDLLSGNGFYQFENTYYIHNYFAQPLGAVTQSTVTTAGKPGRNGGPATTTTTYTRPTGSNATAADGARFVISTVFALRDYEGATFKLVVTLYASGLIEIYFYVLTIATDPSYGTPITDNNVYSVGIQSGSSKASAPTGSDFSQKTLPQLNGQGTQSPNTLLAGRVLSFQPVA